MTEPEGYKSYDESGVDVERGDRCSRIAYEASQRTFANQSLDVFEPEMLEGGFSGPLRINSDLRGASLVKNSDGVGSKALVAQRMESYDSLGFDLIAMLADDAASVGALPVAGTNTLDFGRAKPYMVEELMDGLVEACGVANVFMVGGEIAELPDQVKGYSAHPFVWNGDLLGLLEEGGRIDGSEIEPGQEVVAIRSRGIRSNGLTLAREICCSAFGPDWHEEPYDDELSWGDVLLKQSRICAPILGELTGGFRGKPRAEVTGIVHVTGGGLRNLRRVLPEGTGASLTDPVPPGEEFVRLQELGPVTEEEAYGTWNMGQAVLVVTSTPGKVKKVIEEFEVSARIIGKITDSDDIVCRGKGFEGKEFVL